jgi:ribosomal protein S18 acetylase RimI-like enzyme
MKNDKIHIRPATADDKCIIATTICMAIGFDTTHPAYSVFEKLAVLEQSQYSFRNTLVAEVEGKVAGAIIGYDGALLHQLREVAIPLIRQHLGDGVKLEDETQSGEFYLDSVGILPQFRGMGIGRKLICMMCQRALEQGHYQVGLLVDLDNPRAEALYTSLGFKHIDNKMFMGHQMHHLQIIPDRLKK